MKVNKDHWAEILYITCHAISEYGNAASRLNFGILRPQVNKEMRSNNVGDDVCRLRIIL